MTKNTKIALVLATILIINRKKYNSIGKIVSTDFKPRNRIDDYWGEITPKSWTNTQVPELRDIDTFVDKYNLYGIEFGNWMNQQDRANFLNGTYQSLYHISKVFNVPLSKLGMKNKLLIGLGSRGRGGGAMAHYETTRIAINLTKTKGPGSFAHEYGHAIDNYSMWGRGDTGYASGGRSTTKKMRESISDIENSYEDIFGILYYQDDGEYTPFHESLNKQTDYYQMRTEVFARLFERYCHLKLKEMGITNRFLTDGRTDPGMPPDNLIWKVEKYLRKVVKSTLNQ